MKRKTQLEKVVEQLKSRKLIEVSKSTGIGYNSVRAIASGETLKPRKATMEALMKYLKL